jgi:hypothetical protein
MLNDKGSCCTRNHLMPEGNGAEMFWPLLGTAVKIAQSVSSTRQCNFSLTPAGLAP